MCGGEKKKKKIAQITNSQYYIFDKKQLRKEFVSMQNNFITFRPEIKDVKVISFDLSKLCFLPVASPKTYFNLSSITGSLLT